MCTAVVALALVAALSSSSLRPPQGSSAPPQSDTSAFVGAWNASLASPGGALEFGLEIEQSNGRTTAVVVNADERITIERVAWTADGLELDFPHYDARIAARWDGERLAGRWTKRAAGGKEAALDFAARRSVAEGAASGPKSERALAPRPIAPGRYALDFASDDDPAVLEVVPVAHGLRATVLTTTGDYRFLGVRSDVDDPLGRNLAFSCFDGAHAFLFRAKWIDERTLEGEFWSGATWHDTWTAKLDPTATLPDPFGLTRVDGKVALASLRFRDLDGVERSLDEGELHGAPRIVQLFGTWCPNCNDEAPDLVELDRRFRDRGLRVVGVAFELTGEFARDAAQVRRFRERWKIGYPLLLGGTSDKAEASKAFPLLERVRAYPTTLFVRRDGSVRAVHQGYAGPATGVEHEKQRERFERLVLELLAEPPR
ncbi:MAG: TlpA family protein disulfide reductase [Planctomycetes bacterium]|nr:TlpA family protein disulfide reductase [Planctomycetota bacterium]